MGRGLDDHGTPVLAVGDGKKVAPAAGRGPAGGYEMVNRVQKNG